MKGKPSNLPGRSGGWGWDRYIYIHICSMYIFLFGLELRGYSMSDNCMSERIFNDGFVFKNGSDGSNKGHFLLGRWTINRHGIHPQD